jgi:hypothetical protein
MGGTSYHPNLAMFGKPIMLWYPNFKKGGEIKLAFFWVVFFIFGRPGSLPWFKKMQKKIALL